MLMNMRDKALLLKGLIAFAVILVVGLCVGTFMDLSVAQAIKSEGNPIAIVISTVGLFPLAAPLNEPALFDENPYRTSNGTARQSELTHEIMLRRYSRSTLPFMGIDFLPENGRQLGKECLCRCG